MKEKNIEVGASKQSLRVTNEKTQMFQGNIVITDPCYIMPEDVWIDLCDGAWFDNRRSTDFTEGGTIYFNGAKILYSSTAHGDGGYKISAASLIDDKGEIKQSSFDVDSGTMCVIALEDYKKITNESPSASTCAIVNGFYGEVEADGAGNFIGDLEIYTDDSQKTEDEQNEDSDWEAWEIESDD